MDLRISKNDINKCIINDFHDKVAGKFSCNHSSAEFCIWDSYCIEKKPEFKVLINFGNRTFDYINVYLYRIEDGVIQGKISDFDSIIKTNLSFEIIDIGYMNSTLFFKGSIIKNGKSNRENIIIEFCFEESDFFIEIKQA